MENAYRCIFDEKLYTSYKCSLSECKNCGFNPEVNQRRREEINRLAAQGRLSEWGHPKAQEEVKRNNDEIFFKHINNIINIIGEIIEDCIEP